MGYETTTPQNPMPDPGAFRFSSLAVCPWKQRRPRSAGFAGGYSEVTREGNAREIAGSAGSAQGISTSARHLAGLGPTSIDRGEG